MMLCAFATLGCKNFAVCELYAEWAAQRPEDFSATDLCNAVWAFAELTYHPGLDRLGKLLAEVTALPMIIDILTGANSLISPPCY